MGRHWMRPTPELLGIANPSRRPEEGEQIAVLAWAALNETRYPSLRKLIHVPNGGSRGKVEAVVFKAMGLKPGVSDLFLAASVKSAWSRRTHHGLWLEMKAVGLRPSARRPGEVEVRLGEVSKEQLDWLHDMEGEGYAVWIAWDRTDAQQALERYLRGEWVGVPLARLAEGPFAWRDRQQGG